MYIYTSFLKSRSTQGCLFKKRRKKKSITEKESAIFTFTRCKHETVIVLLLETTSLTVPTLNLFSSFSLSSAYKTAEIIRARSTSDLQQRHEVSKMLTHIGSVLNHGKLYYG